MDVKVHFLEQMILPDHAINEVWQLSIGLLLSLVFLGHPCLDEFFQFILFEGIFDFGFGEVDFGGEDTGARDTGLVDFGFGFDEGVVFLARDKVEWYPLGVFLCSDK